MDRRAHDPEPAYVLEHDVPHGVAPHPDHLRPHERGTFPVNVAARQYLIASAKASGPHRIDRVIECEVGHSPFLRQPEWTVDMLLREAAMVPEEEDGKEEVVGK